MLHVTKMSFFLSFVHTYARTTHHTHTYQTQARIHIYKTHTEFNCCCFRFVHWSTFRVHPAFSRCGDYREDDA